MKNKVKKKIEYVVSYYDYKWSEADHFEVIDSATLGRKVFTSKLKATVFFGKMTKLFDSVEMQYTKDEKDFICVVSKVTSKWESNKNVR